MGAPKAASFAGRRLLFAAEARSTLRARPCHWDGMAFQCFPLSSLKKRAFCVSIASVWKAVETTDRAGSPLGRGCWVRMVAAWLAGRSSIDDNVATEAAAAATSTV